MTGWALKYDVRAFTDIGERWLHVIVRIHDPAIGGPERERRVHKCPKSIEQRQRLVQKTANDILANWKE